MSLRECTCNCLDCIEGRHCGRGEPNPDGTPTLCLISPEPWRYGPEYIEAKVAALPRKVRPALPRHYFKAVELYHQGKKPWRDF